MAVVKNMMVRAGADFSAITTQARKASSSVKGMGTGVSRSFKTIQRAAQGLKTTLSALGVAVSLAALVSGAKDAAKAYEQQAEAEMKLATVMRNTMAARNAEIQGILDLCSAQQKLGVVGDEAQIAGAQELATYLSMSDSLKTLIPVMNDMAAQQYGFNVTAEQTTQIATMLGKAMEGQTGALSRYGYYFTEAEKQVLKFGTEEEKAATLSKIVSKSVGGMNRALAQTPSGRMRQLSNALGDVEEQFGKTAQTLGVLALPLLWRVTDVLQSIASWAEKAANSMTKVFGDVSMLTGWQDVGTGVAALGGSFGDLEDDVTAAGDAAGAAKRKMLGFDELTVLGDRTESAAAETESGETGSGGLLGLLSTDAEKAVSEDLPQLTSFLEKIRDHLDLIKGLAFGVGAGLLTWKVLKGTGLEFKTILGLVMAIAGTVTAVTGGFEAWTEGVNWDNLIEMVGGATVAVLGLALALGPTAAAIGLLVAGVGMLVVGFKDWITTGELSTETFTLLLAGVAALGVALALLTGSWIPLLVAGIVAAVAAIAYFIYDNWEAIKDWAVETWNKVSAWFSKVGAAIRDTVVSAWNGITDFFKSGWEAVKGWAVTTWNKVRAWFAMIGAAIRATVVGAWNGITAFVRSGWEAIKGRAVTAWNKVSAWFTTLGTDIRNIIVNAWNRVTDFLSGIDLWSIGANIMQGFLNGIRSLVGTIQNEVASFAQSVADGVKNVLGIHSPSTVFQSIGQQVDAGLTLGLRAGMPDVMNEMNGIASALETSIRPEIASPDLASGYMAGGAGPEIGSDSDTMEGILAYVMQVYEWLQTEGSRGHVTMIDGREIFETVVEENNRAIRRTGTSPIRV